MKILFESQKFTTDTHGGIVRYFAELMRNFDKMADIEYQMPIAYSNNEYLATLPRFKGKLKPVRSYKDFFPSIQFRGKGRFYRLFVWPLLAKNRHLTRQSLTRQNFDLLHPTYYDCYFLKDLKHKPFVLTVYDMIHEIFMPQNTHLDPTISQKKKLIPLATRIIAISQSTKDDLIRLMNVPPEKIDVIYLGNSLHPSATDLATRPSEMPKPYLLFVGSRGGYKNFIKFATAVAPLLRERTDLQLVCMGQAQFTGEERAMFEKEGITQKVSLFSVSDQKLIHFYAHAEAFVFPSLYEGFGIPVLEAFACGCPAILSNSSSLPEVGGEAAVYFDPQSETSIFGAVKSVLDSKELRESMIAKGNVRLQRFSWKKMADETKETYARAVEQQRSVK